MKNLKQIMTSIKFKKSSWVYATLTPIFNESGVEKFEPSFSTSKEVEGVLLNDSFKDFIHEIMDKIKSREGENYIDFIRGYLPKFSMQLVPISGAEVYIVKYLCRNASKDRTILRKFSIMNFTEMKYDEKKEKLRLKEPTLLAFLGIDEDENQNFREWVTDNHNFNLLKKVIANESVIKTLEEYVLENGGTIDEEQRDTAELELGENNNQSNCDGSANSAAGDQTGSENSQKDECCSSDDGNRGDSQMYIHDEHESSSNIDKANVLDLCAISESISRLDQKMTSLIDTFAEILNTLKKPDPQNENWVAKKEDKTSRLLDTVNPAITIPAHLISKYIYKKRRLPEYEKYEIKRDSLTKININELESKLVKKNSQVRMTMSFELRHLNNQLFNGFRLDVYFPYSIKNEENQINIEVCGYEKSSSHRYMTIEISKDIITVTTKINAKAKRIKLVAESALLLLSEILN